MSERQRTRWLEAWSESADRLWTEWRDDLWLQDLYGKRGHILGPAHGFAGNVFALARGDLLDAVRRTALERRAIATTAKYAQRADGLCQWPPSLESRAEEVRTQCGATSLASLAPHDELLTELLIAGGELTWQAGPLEKGANLCHGTAGNGYAFLKLFERTANELWLEHARVRYARHRTDRADSGQVRSRPTHALDRRPRHRPLPPQLPHRHSSLPNLRPFLAPTPAEHSGSRVADSHIVSSCPLTRPSPT
jgi:hypothetical protein